MEPVTIDVNLSVKNLREIERRVQIVIAESDQLRADNERLRASIISAKTHLESCDVNALGLDPESGHSYLMEMIFNFVKVLDEMAYEVR